MSLDDSIKHPKRKNNIRDWFAYISRHPYFTNTIIAVILFNAILLGIETNQNWYTRYYDLFHALDRILLAIFTIEIMIRLIGSRPLYSFFKDGWNVFDFLIVVSSLLLSGAQFVTVLRILRILRVLRAFSVIPSLRRMINALIMTIPALGNIILLMGIMFYIFGVAGTLLFADIAPEYFGSFGASLLTLFQVVTLESWASGVMRPLLETAPWAWIYFVLFVLVGTFVIFNLFVGVIVNNVDKADESSEEEKDPPPLPAVASAQDARAIQKELTTLRHEIKELKQLLSDNQTQSDRIEH